MEFFRHAPYGAIILWVVGMALLLVATPFIAHQNVREEALRKAGKSPGDEDAEARRQIRALNFVGWGCVLAGLGWFLGSRWIGLVLISR
jgi:hypothetical protein